jgi:hypothetical protein
MTQDVVGALLETFLIASSEQNVQQDVIGFESGIGFEFAAPVAVLVLLGEKPFARAVDGGSYAAGEIVNFAEAQLWSG